MRNAFIFFGLAASILFARPAAAATLNLVPVADSYVDSLLSNVDSNYGTGDTLFIRWLHGPEFTRSFLKFDLSEIPAGSTINSAILNLNLQSVSTTTANQLYANRVESPWTENGITWNNQPTASTTLDYKLLNATGPHTFDLTTAAKNWQSGAWENDGVMIRTTEGMGSELTYGYWPREAAIADNRPTLSVSYTAPVIPNLTISNLSATTTDATAIFTFTSNLTSTGTVEYGDTAAYGSSQSETAGGLVHSLTLTGLTSNKTYHYRLRAIAGSQTTSTPDAVFTTAEAPPPPPPILPVAAGTLVKTPDSSAVYYVTADGKRHAFPNEKTYKSWYADFSSVTAITNEAMASLPLGNNVTYRPGVRMIKFLSLAKTYAIGPAGELRWVQSEALAQTLYGAAWNQKIDDIPDGFFVNYHYGADITAATDFVPSDVTAATPTIEANQS